MRIPVVTSARAQPHLYLPAIFPEFYAKPMFGN
jgi:hypothetical protein